VFGEKPISRAASCLSTLISPHSMYIASALRGGYLTGGLRATEVNHWYDTVTPIGANRELMPSPLSELLEIPRHRRPHGRLGTLWRSGTVLLRRLERDYRKITCSSSTNMALGQCASSFRSTIRFHVTSISICSTVGSEFFLLLPHRAAIQTMDRRSSRSRSILSPVDFSLGAPQ
jgi:hypothetical protein